MITEEQRARLMAVINRQPTNPPAPRLSIAELDEIRMLINQGRELDAWAELCAKGNAANAKSFEATKRISTEIAREAERHRLEQREHMVQMAALRNAQARPEQEITVPAPQPTMENQVSVTRRKRGALVQEVGDIWPTIDSDLREASRNGLSDVAKLKGAWCLKSTLSWGLEKGKICKWKAKNAISHDSKSELSVLLQQLLN